MTKKQYHKSYNYHIHYRNLIPVRKFEGGAEYSAEKGDKYFLISDESTLSEFVDDLDDILITIIEFADKYERERYISNRKY